MHSITGSSGEGLKANLARNPSYIAIAASYREVPKAKVTRNS